MTRIAHRTLLAGTLCLAAAGPLAAQPAAAPPPPEPVPAAPAQPALPPGQEQALQATVIAVEGPLVRVRTLDQEWQRPEVGMVLDAGAEFFTGPKSRVAFTIPPDQTVVLDRLGTVQILEAVGAGNQVRTQLGMTSGRVLYQVEAAGVEHTASIKTPGQTLAVRGTYGMMIENTPPFAIRAVSFNTPRVRLSQADGRSTTFGSEGDTVAVNAQIGTAPGTALDESQIDPRTAFSGRTPVEEDLLNQFPLLGGVDFRSNGIAAFHALDVRNTFARYIQTHGSPGGGVFAEVTATFSPLAVRIFDNAFEDGDRVRVIFNNQVLNNDLFLTNSGTFFDLDLNPGVNTLTLVNVFTPEGGGLLNTGSVQFLTDFNEGGPTFDFEMNQLGEQRSARIRFEPESEVPSNAIPRGASGKRKRR